MAKKIDEKTAAQVHELGAKGLSDRAIARELGIGATSVRRYRLGTVGEKPSSPARAPATSATTLAEASIIAISPRRFEFSSSLL